MLAAPLKNFNLPWNQHESYQLCVFVPGGKFSAKLLPVLTEKGFTPHDNGSMALTVPRQWKALWDGFYAAALHADALADVEIGLAPENQGVTECKTPAAIAHIAESLWLGDALMEDRLMCYLQPVMSAREQILGYESFVRVRATDGSIIAGDRIIAASKVLGIEFAIDRHLHIQAIKTFVSSECNGFLFINFFPGFIHRPAVYLEGLSETAKNFGIIPKHIVLDFTNSENTHDMAHLANICNYGRTRGYSIALDDVSSLDSVMKLLEIRQIVELVHATGGTVIAEGVETDATYQILKQLGVQLFQGYLFSPPMPVDTVLKRSTGTV
jgi:EAL domain-containing protein (putative c-di-GMP-specific phosphodiesterase class I)